jgi:nucleoside-diphosphate-sugar epimerase
MSPIRKRRAASHGVEGVFHLAAISSVGRASEDLVRAHQVNAMGSVVVSLVMV